MKMILVNALVFSTGDVINSKWNIAGKNMHFIHIDIFTSSEIYHISPLNILSPNFEINQSICRLDMGLFSDLLTYIEKEINSRSTIY